MIFFSFLQLVSWILLEGVTLVERSICEGNYLSGEGEINYFVNRIRCVSNKFHNSRSSRDERIVSIFNLPCW